MYGHAYYESSSDSPRFGANRQHAHWPPRRRTTEQDEPSLPLGECRCLTCPHTQSVRGGQHMPCGMTVAPHRGHPTGTRTMTPRAFTAAPHDHHL